MNKKKKKTRIKHRKNQDRVKKIIQSSMLKKKSKNIVKTTKVDEKVVEKTMVIMAPSKKAPS